jgi:ribonuclease HI
MTPCDSSNEAEAMATVNTLFHAIRSGVIEAGDIVLFQIDSLRALQVIGWKQLPPTATRNERDAFYRLDAMRRSHRLTYRTRHVKGHQRPTSGTRSQVNNLCDRAARKAMEELREKLAAGFQWPLLRPPEATG